MPGGNQPDSRLVMYMPDGTPIHLSNLWSSDKDSVIRSGKTTAQYLDDKLPQIFKYVLDNNLEVRFVVFASDPNHQGGRTEATQEPSHDIGEKPPW